VQTKPYRKCVICGTWGHPKGVCPVAQLNREQEQLSGTAVFVLGLRPELEQQVAQIRLRWQLSLHAASL
jgi:hypothetical protein